jgi:hypothetical protein
MSFAYYIVLDNENPGFDDFVNGKAVARLAHELDALCEKLGLPYLDSFMGQSLAELEQVLGEPLNLPAGKGGKRHWYEPREGLAVVESIIQHMQYHPQPRDFFFELLEDLHEFRTVLHKACNIGARWHLAVDM